MKKKITQAQISIFSVIACSLVYLTLVWNNNVWMDEAFTASLAHHSFKDVLYLSMLDTLPPLYNLYLKLTTTIFGYTVPVMKITSVMPMIFTMILSATVIRKRFNLVTSLIFNLCITAMPLMLYYGVEIRMYSLGFFFATASGIFCYECLCESNFKNWAFFTVFSVLAGYSHHFAFVAVGFVYLFMLLYYFFGDRAHILRWFKCLAATIILYFPCLLVTLKQMQRVNGYFSMPDITIRLFIQYALYPFTVGFTAASILCLIIVLFILCQWGRFFLTHFSNVSPGTVLSDTSVSLGTVLPDTSKWIYSLCMFLVYYGVLIFGTIVSKIMTANIFVDRYLFYSTGLLWLGVSIVIGMNKNTKIICAVTTAIGLIFISSYIIEYRIEYSTSATEEITFLRENVNDGDLFFGLGGHEEMDNCIPFMTLISGGSELTYVYPLDNALQTARDTNVTLWLSILDGYELSPEEVNLIESYGYTLDKEADFEFDRYKCELYKCRYTL